MNPLKMQFQDRRDAGKKLGKALLKHEKERPLVLAIPRAIESLRAEVDELVCLSSPVLFRAVGEHYLDFEQTTDEEVIKLLDDAREWTQYAMKK